jgi:hypothetical protein
MLGSERMKTKGVVPPEGLAREERDVFMKELTERGFVYKEIVEKSLS